MADHQAMISAAGRSHFLRALWTTLEQIAALASAKLPPEEPVRFSAHVPRHTFLRKLARKVGVEFAMEAAGHCSSQYIGRYVKPSEQEKVEAVQGLF